MYRLYYSPGAASLVVHWLLIELGVPHELRKVDLAAKEQKRPEYLALNPGGVVPTLLIDDQPFAEAAALLLHLADRHPEARFAPAVGTAERGSYYQWMLLLANTLQPAFRVWWYPHEPAGEKHIDAAKEKAREKIEAVWDRIDEHLGRNGPYLLGESPCASDFMLTMLMRWSRNMPRTATDWPNLAALAARMKSRPSFAELYRREGLTEWA